MGKSEILQQWLDKGNDDLRSAEYLSTMHHPTPDEIICYHCQQSSEKYLKGFLFLHDIEPPQIHKLIELLGMCGLIDSSFSVLLPQLNVLTDYGVLPRYPNELGITNDDMKIAIKYAKIVQEFVLKAIDEKAKSEGTLENN
ncbi:MAG: HEPN domain-containing protein [Treponema sp.]|nr:HEPN domain-containing protein [Treponema sp.]